MDWKHPLDVLKDYLPVWTGLGSALATGLGALIAHRWKKREAAASHKNEIEKLRAEFDGKLTLANAERSEAKRVAEEALKPETAKFELVSKGAETYTTIFGTKPPTEAELFRFVFGVIGKEFRGQRLIEFDSTGKMKQVNVQLSIFFYERIQSVMSGLADRAWIKELAVVFKALTRTFEKVVAEMRGEVKAGILSDGEIDGIKLAFNSAMGRGFPLPKQLWNAFNRDDRTIDDGEELVAALKHKDLDRIVVLFVKLEFVEKITGEKVLIDGLTVKETFDRMVAEAHAQVARAQETAAATRQPGKSVAPDECRERQSQAATPPSTPDSATETPAADTSSGPSSDGVH